MSALRFRAVLLLVLVLPLIGGAVYAGIKPKFDRTDTMPKVALVVADGLPANAPASRLAASLSGSQDYDWQSGTADQVAKGLSDGSLLAAVTIPAAFGNSASSDNPDSRRVTVMPGRTQLDAGTYAALVQEVSAAAAKLGVNDLLVAISKAKTNLDNAQFTAGVIKAAAGQAGDALQGAFGSVDKLVAQATPMLSQAQSMLATIQQISGTVDKVASMLSAAGEGLRGLNLTVADLQNGANAVSHGADATASAVYATGPLRAQVRGIVQPIADALRASGIADAQKMADQLASLITLVGGQSDAQATAGLTGIHNGAALASAQLNDMSELLNAKVDAHTKLSDVLLLGANRLRELTVFMSQGKDTINQVVGQVSGATGQIPAMKANIQKQLDQFKAVTAQLSNSLVAGNSALPQGGDATASAVGDPLLLGNTTTDSPVSDKVMRAVLVLLIGALLIALVRPWVSTRVPTSAGRAAAIVPEVVTAVFALGLAAVDLPVLGSVPRLDAAFALLALSSLALVALAVAMLRLLGDKIGIVSWVCIIGAAAIFSGGLHAGHGAAVSTIHRLLPSSYAATGLSDAATSGINSGLLLPIAVLAALGIAAVAASIVTSRRAAAV